MCLLLEIERYSKFSSVQITKSTWGKSSNRFLHTFIDTHGIPVSIRNDHFSGFKMKAMKNSVDKTTINKNFVRQENTEDVGWANELFKASRKDWEQCFWMKTLHQQSFL